MNALDRLESGLAWALQVASRSQRRRRGDRDRDVALSRGGSVALPEARRMRQPRRRRPRPIGEVVRIDDAQRSPSSRSTRAATPRSARAPIAPRSCRLRRSASWKGRVIDALGRPIDSGGPCRTGRARHAARRRAAAGDAPLAASESRSRAASASSTSSRRSAPDSGSASSPARASANRRLLAMLARSPDFDTVVIALVGERGREVREFLDDTLAANRALGDRRRLDRRRKPDDAAPRAAGPRWRSPNIFAIAANRCC